MQLQYTDVATIRYVGGVLDGWEISHGTPLVQRIAARGGHYELRRIYRFSEDGQPTLETQYFWVELKNGGHERPAGHS